MATDATPVRLLHPQVTPLPPFFKRLYRFTFKRKRDAEFATPFASPPMPHARPPPISTARNSSSSTNGISAAPASTIALASTVAPASTIAPTPSTTNQQPMSPCSPRILFPPVVSISRNKRICTSTGFSPRPLQWHEVWNEGTTDVQASTPPLFDTNSKEALYSKQHLGSGTATPRKVITIDLDEMPSPSPPLDDDKPKTTATATSLGQGVHATGHVVDNRVAVAMPTLRLPEDVKMKPSDDAISKCAPIAALLTAIHEEKAVPVKVDTTLQPPKICVKTYPSDEPSSTSITLAPHASKLERDASHDLLMTRVLSEVQYMNQKISRLERLLWPSVALCSSNCRR